jgi:hypothetical protein
VAERLAASYEGFISMKSVSLEDASSYTICRLLVCYVVTFCMLFLVIVSTLQGHYQIDTFKAITALYCFF